ncbi:MAG: ABC transporter ATP-binding protein [Coriobacteriales bacterium]|jgi:ABC-2 type transport system ATP-binding protein|nr:ABC transporter ATP-binding protein [Coriobacteriales bacterium]
MADVLLQTRGLTKKYGEFAALNDVSLTLRRGDIYGLVGRNGAGKTTFFKCVMGLAKSTAGQIEMVGGQNLNAARRSIGFMINPAFFPYLGPRQNLSYLCKVKGISAKTEPDRLLQIVGLQGVKKPYKSFSLGMKQRLGIAGALLGSPPIIVLDEPINGLDPQGIADIRNLISQINQQLGTTFLISSHILSELDLVATTFGFIEQGRLVKEISHTDLHENTRRSLLIDVNSGEKAAAVLIEQMHIDQLSVHGNRLVIGSQLDKPNEMVRHLVQADVEVYSVMHQQTTLEEYFMRLIGGGNNA